MSKTTETSKMTKTVVPPTVFEWGEHAVNLIKIESDESCSRNPQPQPPSPKPLLLAVPREGGEYPVVVLLHGFLLYNTFYSQLMQHIASHGFLVIAPQLYTVAGPDAEPDMNTTASILNWLPLGLPSNLPDAIIADLSKLALSGHSRGGKVAFAVALQRSLSITISALIAIDPVDGMDRGKQTKPPVLTYTPLSFNLSMPVMVIGTGLGELRRNPLFPACAPAGVNHGDFFDECRSPACHLVARDYGHLDMLDDETGGIRGKATYCLCKNGKAREPMRRFVGGSLIAFMNAYLKGDDKELLELKDRPEIAPLALSVVTFR